MGLNIELFSSFETLDWILQSQQHAERDAALTRLEESRSILLKMLTEHRGRELKVIQEALAFAADRSEEEDLHLSPHGFQNTTTAQGNSAIYCQKNEKNDEKSDLQDKRLYGLPHFVSFSIRYVKKSDRLHKMAGVVAKTALVAVSMLAVLGLQQTGQRTMKNSGIQERSRVQKKNNDYKEHQKSFAPVGGFFNFLEVQAWHVPAQMFYFVICVAKRGFFIAPFLSFRSKEQVRTKAQIQRTVTSIKPLNAQNALPLSLMVHFMRFQFPTAVPLALHFEAPVFILSQDQTLREIPSCIQNL
eukprot:Gb_32349 [translate_table: standard]